jgi:glycosyltransferase involved in cell wall biosynthesis
MVAGVLSVQPDTDVRLIPNTSDIARFRVQSTHGRSHARSEVGIGSDVKYIVYAGSLGRIYDTSLLVELGARLRDDGVVIRILGEGLGLEGVRAHAASLGLDPLEVAPGPVPAEMVVQHYRASDFVYSGLADEPSIYDASINKIFDAFATGRPLLCNHPGWLAELAVASGAGWILDRDIDSAVANVRTLIQDDRAASLAGLRSGALADKHFSTETLYKALERALLEASARD